MEGCFLRSLAVSGGAGSKHNTVVGRGGRRRGNRYRSKRPFPKTMPIQTSILQSVMAVAWAFQLKFSQGVVQWDVPVDKHASTANSILRVVHALFLGPFQIACCQFNIACCLSCPMFPFPISAVLSAVLLYANSICWMSIPCSPLQIL